MQIPEARWIVWGTLLLFALMIAVYITFFFRNLAFGEAEVDTTELLTDFRKMRDHGQLEDEEYSKLKTRIPGVGIGRTGKRVENREGDADNGQEKKFLTLAEAQRQKEELEKQNGSDGNDDASESTSSE